MADDDRILFKLFEPSDVQVPGDAATLAAAVEDSLTQIANDFGVPFPQLLLADMDADEVQAAVDEARTDNPGEEADVPNPLLCFALDVDPAGNFSSAEQLADAVFQLQAVEWSQIDGTAVAAVTPGDDPAFPLQTYLNSAPVGIDAGAAWGASGGGGAGVTVGVVEPYFFDDTHRDLPTALTLLTQAPSSLAVRSLDHATGILGIIAAADNTVDCIGIVPQSSIVFGSGIDPSLTFRESELFLLLHRVGFQLGRGDVLNASIGIQDNARTGGFPLDFKPSSRTAAQLLSFRGTTVVEGAANGINNQPGTPCAGIDLDLAPPAGIVSAGTAAIVVGGVQAATPSGPFSRWQCSNFGSRVDCCAAAQDVLTLVAMTVDASGTPTQTVGTQAGTSFATAIVSGVVASMQGIRKANGSPPLTPAEVKTIFKDPARTSDPCPGQRIGRMPDLAAIVPTL